MNQDTAPPAVEPILERDLSPYARRPCPFAPGSDEKIAVLQLRAALRVPLFVSGDRSDQMARASRAFLFRRR